jgi:hypothetical protein
MNKWKIIEDFEQKHMKQVKNSFHCDIVCVLGGKSCYVGNILKGQYIYVCVWEVFDTKLFCLLRQEKVGMSYRG